MKFEGEYIFEADRELVFETLQDPEALAAVLPGCDSLELVDGVYQGRMKIKVGPVQGKFKGTVEVSDVVEPESYAMKVSGKGAPGFVKADATVELVDEGEHSKMIYRADARVGGKIATVGQRLVDTTARAIIKESLEGLHDIVKARAEHVAQDDEDEAAASPQEPEGADEEPTEDAAAKLETSSERAPAEEEPKPEKKAKKRPTPKPTPKRSEAEVARRIAAEVSKELVPAPVRYALIAAAVAAVVAVLYFVLR